MTSPTPTGPSKPKAATLPTRGAAALSSLEARAALAWLHGSRFLTTASQLNQLPAGELPEIAFVGRSNAGKSTAINTLAQRRRLAFASRTPGRTQHINLFEVGPKDQPDAYLADLPGYGYAAVERSAKLRWQAVMSDYLQLRRNLHGVVLMVDSRLGFTDLDKRLLALLEPRLVNGEVRLLALMTKADKLNKNELHKSLNEAQAVLSDLTTDEADIAVTPFSALSRLGVGDVAEVLHSWVAVKQTASLAGHPAASPGGMADAADAADAADPHGAATPT